MNATYLLDHLVTASAQRNAQRIALSFGDASVSYGDLNRQVSAFAAGLMHLGVARQERVGIYLEKRFEAVISDFGTVAAGAAFVPLNPLLKPEQVGYILRDCNVRVLVTSPERLAILAEDRKSVV
jgi:acyl-CoA synthetase (AMP-forming)/AMP-acid ligase II